MIFIKNYYYPDEREGVAQPRRCECRSMAGANESRLAMRACERDYYLAVLGAIQALGTKHRTNL